MLYRRFGRTELQMPVFSCGGMRYQFKQHDNQSEKITPQQQQNLEATIIRAFDLGINHIETARLYGASEIMLGKILPKFPREELIVQTKTFPVAEPHTFRQKFEKSLKCLQLDYVDLLGLHGINNAETLNYSLRDGGCLEVAKQQC
jgi:predicted aldo/keto reductase-like oxidoreductase